MAAGVSTGIRVNTTTKASCMVSSGLTFVGRYYKPSVAGSYEDRLQKPEAQTISNAGMSIFSIYQYDARSTASFTSAQAHTDGATAVNQAVAAGQPTGTAIYFAVDYDATASDLSNIIVPYFKIVKTYLDSYGYQLGVYGGYRTTITVGAAIPSIYRFQTDSWSNGQADPSRRLYQYTHNTAICSSTMDKVESIGSFGGWKL
ncbi:DUF1906 domain-containing protein [Paenibacillus donghaensis]|uniref:Rv2525c-like glycoside hydrolase-like domain-containing protein n=1 Tax=Paenibacillus donghaensis TaxID=414771 RepID=A0A2Z2KUA2_9BACL|nr:DUF1906 domain-containing protein [Paenibacillus donghaensis]ASA24611.1 hypothetical protein B9T62_29970 [Paenibacillus donghaensis]